MSSTHNDGGWNITWTGTPPPLLVGSKPEGLPGIFAGRARSFGFLSCFWRSSDNTPTAKRTCWGLGRRLR